MGWIRMLGACVVACVLTGRQAFGEAPIWVLAGEPKAQILLPDQPKFQEQVAARELQHHIALRTGATLPIRAESKRSEAYPIFLGNTDYALARADRPVATLASGAFFLDIDEQAACLVGDRAVTTREAVHRWLMAELGVRWVEPGDRGITFPTPGLLPTLQVTIRYDLHLPAFEWWRIWPLKPDHRMLQELWGHPDEQESKLYLDRMGFGLSGPGSFGANHSFYGFYARFWAPEDGQEAVFVEQRPDWFAKGYGDRKPPQLCYTHPEVIAQVIADARAVFDGHARPYRLQGSVRHIVLVPMDNSDFCRCERCQAAGSVGRPKDMVYGWPTSPTFASGANSDYFFGFVRQVAEALAESHPDRFVATLAYRDYSYPPVTPLPPNVAVQICLDVRRHDSEIWEKQYRAWVPEGGDERIFSVWLYTYFPLGTGRTHRFTPFPGAAARELSRAVKMWHRDGIRGWFYNGIPELADFDVLTRLWREPQLAVDQVLEEFHTRAYGPAAAEIAGIYQEIQDLFLDRSHYPADYQRQTEAIAWGTLGTPERIARWAALFERAVERAATGSQEQQDRVRRFGRAVIEPMQEASGAYRARLSAADEIGQLRLAPPPRQQVPAVLPAAGRVAAIDWNRAAPLRFRQRSGHASDAPVIGWIAHDGAYLYLRLLETGIGEALPVGSTLWGGAHWELFLATQRDLPYFLLAVNPAGVHQGLSFLEPEQRIDQWIPWPVQPEVTSRYEPGGDRWDLSLAVPLASVGLDASQGGQRLFANVFYDRLRLAMGPTFEENHHVLERMVELELLPWRGP